METLPEYRLARQFFDTLTASEKAAAVRHMADEGHGDYTIAQATQLNVEQVRQIVGARCGSK